MSWNERQEGMSKEGRDKQKGATFVMVKTKDLR